MNRIYKVIWNKVRNAYVVVSELAKNHGKEKCEASGSQGFRLGMVLLLGLLLGGSMAAGGIPAEAAAVNAGTTTNANENTLAVGDNTTASGAGALTVGGGSSSSGTRAIAIAGGKASSDYTIAIGEDTKAGGTYTYAQGSTSGLSGEATQAIAIGRSAVAQGVNDVVIGSNETAATPTNAFVESNANGSNGVAVGGRVLMGHDNTATGRAANSVLVGSNNFSNAAHGIAIGQNAAAGMPVGFTNRKGEVVVYENSMAIGTNTRSYATSTIAIGNNAVAGNTGIPENTGNYNGQGAIALGENASSTAYYTVAIGGKSTASNAFAIAIGEEASATEGNTLAMGYGAKASARGSIALGDSASASALNDIALGNQSAASGGVSVAMGFAAKAKGGYTIAIGNNANAQDTGSIVLGSASVAKEGGVALGYRSSATRAAETKGAGWKTMDGTWTSWLSAKDTSVDSTHNKWNSSSGVVSVGSDSKTGNYETTRQITGVAAGVYDTDAVNMAQWKNTMLATVGDDKADTMTTTYGTDGKARNVTTLLNESLTFTGAGDTARSDASNTATKTLKKSELTSEANIGTIVSDNQIDIRLARNLEGLESVTTGNTVVNNSGLAITNGTKSVSLTDGGLNNGGNTITNVASGVVNHDSSDNTNAANIGDVKNLASSMVTVSGGKNTNVTTTTGKDGSKAYQVNLDDTVLLGSVESGEYIRLTGSESRIQVGPNLSLDGTIGEAYVGGVNIGYVPADNTLTYKDKDGHFLAPGIAAGSYVRNLDNKTWDVKNPLYLSGRAATEDQLAIVSSAVENAAAEAGKHTTVTVEGGKPAGTGTTYSGTNLQLNTSTGTDGGTVYDLKLSKDIDLTADGSIKTGNTTINKDGVETNKITIKDSSISIDKNGIDAGNTVIKDVHSGIVKGDDTDNSNAANIGDVKKIAGDAAEGAKARSGKNITVKADNTVNLNDQITLGSETNKAQQVTIDGDGATVTAGDGDNQVKLDGSKGQITAGGATLGKQANTSGDKNPASGSYLNGLDNKNWDGEHIQSGRAATEDQLKVVDDKISGGRVFQGDDGKANAVTVGLGSTLNLTGGADTANLVSGNIGVVKNSDGDGLEIKLAKDIKGLDSVTTGNTTIDSSGVTIKSSDATKGGDIKIATGDVSMGGSQIHDVAPGTNGTDAVNMNQLSGAMNNVERNLTKLDTRVNRAGANAAALAALHPLDFDPDDKLDVAAGTGHYNGANAVAIGAFYRPNEDTMISLGGSMGGGENMINAGVTFKLGQHNHVSTTRVAMAKEIKALKALVNQQYGEMQQMKQMVNQLAGKTALSVDTSALFPDIPQNHWAYEYVTKLAHTGILQGYPDGEFKGDRMMTRYEFATMLYRAIMSGAASNPDLNKDGTLDKLTKEFEPELKYIRIDVIQKDKDGVPTIERVRTTEAAKYHKAGK